MRNTSTSSDESQGKGTLREPETHTTGAINPNVECRDTIRLLNPDYSFAHLTGDETLTMHFAPGGRMSGAMRTYLERRIGFIPNPVVPPAAVDIEFSPEPIAKLTADFGAPEDYTPSILRWALGVGSAVVIAVTAADGREPYARIRPVQMVIRCSEAQIDLWIDYLGRRVRPRQRFAVVRFAAVGART